MSAVPVPGKHWEKLERQLAAPRVQLFVMLVLGAAFAVFRWLQRLEPWNSDDMDLFELAQGAAAGDHWLFESPARGADGAPVRLKHPAFRIGLLPLALPGLKVFGATALVYYLVPFTFALIGFGALYWVVRAHFGSLVALVAASIHLIWPFELEHASVFLTDLPAAASGLASLCLLGASEHREGRQRAVLVILAGLAGWEAYLLRNNTLVLLGPAYLIFLWARATRVQTLWAGAVVLSGVMVQQGLLVYRGLGLGYDWQSVREGFAGYAQFLPVYSWRAFLVRQFTYQVSTFGPGVVGYLAALLVAASLVLHVVLLRFERRTVLRAIAAFGLFTWLLFSFSIYERVLGGVRANVPVMFRYVQAFQYSSLVVWVWTWCGLRTRVSVARAEAARPGSASWRALGLGAACFVPLLLGSFSAVVLDLRWHQTYLEGSTRRLVETIEEQEQRAAEPLVIAGTSPTLRVPRLFCCEAPRRVEWRESATGELREQIGGGGGPWVLRDFVRELRNARYLELGARHAYRAELAEIEETLWREYELAYVDSRYALFAPQRSASGSAGRVRGSELEVPAEPPGPELLSQRRCRAAGEGVASRILPPSRGSCEDFWQEDGRVLPASSSSGFVLRLETHFESPVSLFVEVVERSGSGVRRRPIRLHPGTSYVPVPSGEEERTVFLVYRVKTPADAGDQSVRIDPAEWSLYGGGSGGARRSEEAGGI